MCRLVWSPEEGRDRYKCVALRVSGNLSGVYVVVNIPVCGVYGLGSNQSGVSSAPEGYLLEFVNARVCEPWKYPRGRS